MSVFSTQSSRLDPDEEWDFTCDSGIAHYNKMVRVDKITTNRLNAGFFYRRLDGTRHPTISSPYNAYCQYCAYNHSHVLKGDEKLHLGSRRRTERVCADVWPAMCTFAIVVIMPFMALTWWIRVPCWVKNKLCVWFSSSYFALDFYLMLWVESIMYVDVQVQKSW